MTELQEYADFVAKKSSKNPPDMVAWAIAGLVAEAGEVSGVIEKAWRKRGHLNEDDMAKLKDEIGDVVFFAFAVMNACQIDPDDVIMDNIIKLNDREEKGTLIAR